MQFLLLYQQNNIVHWLSHLIRNSSSSIILLHLQHLLRFRLCSKALQSLLHLPIQLNNKTSLITTLLSLDNILLLVCNHLRDQLQRDLVLLLQFRGVVRYHLPLQDAQLLRRPFLQEVLYLMLQLAVSIVVLEEGLHHHHHLDVVARLLLHLQAEVQLITQPSALPSPSFHHKCNLLLFNSIIPTMQRLLFSNINHHSRPHTFRLPLSYHPTQV